METKEAIKVLSDHQKWRNGENDNPINPIKLSDALEVAIKIMSESVVTVKERCDYNHKDIDGNELFCCIKK